MNELKKRIEKAEQELRNELVAIRQTIRELNMMREVKDYDKFHK